MYKHIIMATDGSDLAIRALRHGFELAKTVGATVSVITVTEPVVLIGAGYAGISGAAIDPVPHELIEAQIAAARKVLADAETLGRAAGVSVQTAVVENSYPAEGIVAQAEAVGADLIVMGSHGRRGLSRLLLGSQTNNVLVHAKIPVLVVR